YDANGDLASAKDPILPTGDLTQYCYDGVGRLTAMISPRGSAQTCANATTYVTRYSPNAFGLNTLTTDPLGRLTHLYYDANRNLTKITDANNNSTQYAYDADDELTKVTRPDLSTQQTGYDGVGHVLSQTD